MTSKPDATGAQGTSLEQATRLEIVRTTERLQEIGDAWETLWEQADAPVFQCHAWVAAWWHAVPDPHRRGLMIVLAWSGDRLDAVMPLAICRLHGIRVLEWAAKDYSDYCDVLLRPCTDPALAVRMWDYVSAQGGFDAAYLPHLLPTATATTLTRRTTGGLALHPHHRQATSLRVVGRWENGQAWFDSQSGNARRNYRRALKSLSEGAKVEFRRLGPGEQLGPALQRCAELKRAWCARNGLIAPLFDEGSPMLPALAQVLADKNLLHVFVLERDGIIVAITINLVQHDTMMAYVTTYDSAFERGSPGYILLYDYIRWAIDQGATCIDFLCGDEDYKYRFANQQVTLASFVGGRTLLGKMALQSDRVWHAVQSYRSRHQRPTSKAAPRANDERAGTEAVAER
ncbi:GNAT family N-acetyltransferase [Rhodopseudomonas palustris]|uniref:GNAT family N-acetyltransferase n=1 Tax=Rhodopseudomonas palustris TaxID=1076 RepID=A0A323UL55_RHOPL|nr:GNAT family N-acetyltransferase [Rhodopseudomonas palustris]PZA12937.1 GNAT family N-acetyltransferase [Rhodopseudomonas palustris]